MSHWTPDLDETMDRFKADTFALVEDFESDYLFFGSGGGIPAPNAASLEVGHITAGMDQLQIHGVKQQIMELQLIQLSVDKQDLAQKLAWEQSQRYYFA